MSEPEAFRICPQCGSEKCRSSSCDRFVLTGSDRAGSATPATTCGRTQTSTSGGPPDRKSDRRSPSDEHRVGRCTPRLRFRRRASSTMARTMSAKSDALMDEVAEVLREVSTEAIEPRFEALREGDVRPRRPGSW